MVTQVAARAGAWLDGVAVAGQDLRLELGSAGLTSAGASTTTGISATQGVRPATSPLACTWTSGMSFTLAAGTCYIQGTASATAGMYVATLDTTTTLTVTTADATNPRIDSVIAVVSDVGSSSSTTLFKILPGTPASSPVAPTLPANALLLANIAVAASASTLSAGVFTDKRVFTVPPGGILPYGTTTGATINGPAGSYVDDLATGRLRRLDGSGNARQALTGQFTPVSGSGGSTTVTTSAVTLASASVTTDGVTEIEIVARWFGFNSFTATVGDVIQLSITVDGSAVDTWDLRVDNTSTSVGLGGTYLSYTTPSAATHTVALKALFSGSASSYTSAGAKIRVAPAFA